MLLCHLVYLQLKQEINGFCINLVLYLHKYYITILDYSIGDQYCLWECHIANFSDSINAHGTVDFYVKGNSVSKNNVYIIMPLRFQF